MKYAKNKNSIFDTPFIVNQTFSQTKVIVGKADFAHKCLIFSRFEINIH